MTSSGVLLKRLLVGRPVRSDRPRQPSPPAGVALPVYGADPLSSLAYAPGQILVTLSAAGAAGYAYAPWVAVMVAAVLLFVVASYRQVVRAYPAGRGAYGVAMTNLGPAGGVLVAGSLLVDYLLTVAVSVSAAVDSLASAAAVDGWSAVTSMGSFVADHRAGLAVTAVVVLVGVNLRGIRPGPLWAVPGYLFVLAMTGLVAWGGFRILVRGEQLRAPTADLAVTGTGAGLAGLALVVLLARGVSAGGVALTGVQTLADQVPGFRPPGGRRTANGLLLVGLVSATLLVGLVWLADRTGVRYVEDPAGQLPGVPPGRPQPSVTGQLAGTVFDQAELLAYLVLAAVALVLLVAANNIFDAFPVLGAMLAADRYLPRQLHTRGDRLAFSNGILLLGAGATVLVVAFQADVVALVHLYIVGVFVAFTLSQAGMVRHWSRVLRTEPDPPARRRAQRARVVNAVGATLTGLVLLLVLVSKFSRGAWISIALIALGYLLMRGIRRHYDRVAAELAPEEERPVLPARNHAIVLVSTVHKPTLRALAYARATRPDTLTAVTVDVDSEQTRRLLAEWEGRDLGVPLTVMDSPFREITRPVVEYVRSVRRSSPRDVVTVFVPEYVVGRWWENLLHNQSALRLKARLRFVPGVMVTSVPWQLVSSSGLSRMEDRMVRRHGSREVPDFERPPAE